MVLRQKLRSTKMTKTNSVTPYLSKISQVKNELVVVGEASPKNQLVRIAMDGFIKKWDGFIHGIVASEHFPHWRMWDDFIQGGDQEEC